MRYDRRQFLTRMMTAPAACAHLWCAVNDAIAQNDPAYPAGPVRLVVGFSPGGIADVMARLTAHHLSLRLGQSVIVENRPGAGSNTATDAVVKAAPDGQTLVIIGATTAINYTLQKKGTSSLLKDLVPVACLYRDGPGVMVVNSSFAAQSLPAFIDYAKTHPDDVYFASAGVGTTQHMFGEMFKMLTGIRMNHVPYRGGPAAITDLLAGRVQVMFDNIGNCMPQIQAGWLVPLGITTRSRAPALPDVPAIGETITGYEATGWVGIGTPRKTPAHIVLKLNQSINAFLADPVVLARFTELGYTPSPSDPKEFEQFVAGEVDRWAKVIQFSGTKAE